MTTAAPPGPRIAERVQAVDMLRGLVMVIMAIDHTRDFVHSAAMKFPPEDLGRTTTAIFFTRWITHVCAPAFMFCAGLGAWLRLQRGGSMARAVPVPVDARALAGRPRADRGPLRVLLQRRLQP